MHNQPHAFKDAKGMPWTLTALAIAGTQYVLESAGNTSICVMAQHAAIALDETSPQSPFVLELDHNTSIAVDEPTMEKLDEFLQAVAA
jgi:hypothetical protein